ncbi:hypothetical protein GC167_01700 [bacterium]|nr:hypothetical protein [bacterium]
METENTENPQNTPPSDPRLDPRLDPRIDPGLDPAADSRLERLWTHWPRWARNRYILSGAAFALWMTFLDSNSLLLHWDLHQEQKRLEREIRHYRAEVRKDSTRLYELTGNPQALEKFARERYWLAKSDEQIYWVEESE